MKIQGATLSELVRARGFSLGSLANRTEIDRGLLAATMEDAAELDESQVTALAEQLAVPPHVLFMRRAPELIEAVDFRRAEPRTRRLSKGTLDAMAYAERLSATLADLDLDLGVAEYAQADVAECDADHAIQLAEVWRDNWGLSVQEQLEYRDPNRLYTTLRSFIEEIGVIVHHYTFGSDEVAGLYAQIGRGPHIILINTTRSSKARKCFTLAHEFCHFLLRAEGASNPSIIRNDIERFCNKFAAHLLAPDGLVKIAVQEYGREVSGNNDFIRLFARRISISQEATIRRLVELRLLPMEAYEAWRAQFRGLTPTGDTADGAGGNVDPIQTKRTRYGARLLGLLREAKQKDDLDELEVYRLCGLKPRFQRQLFAA